ncbi:hypothetical protein Tco_1230501, partial [Tanacetum coccineum]
YVTSGSPFLIFDVHYDGAFNFMTLRYENGLVYHWCVDKDNELDLASARDFLREETQSIILYEIFFKVPHLWMKLSLEGKLLQKMLCVSVVDKGKGLADKGKGLVDKGKKIMVDERNAGRKSARIRNSGIVIKENVNPTVSKDDDSDSDKIVQRFKGSAALEEMYKGPNRVYDVGESDTMIEHEEYMEKLIHQLRVGEKYVDVAQLKECLTYYSFANWFSLWFYRSYNERSYGKKYWGSNDWLYKLKIGVTVNPDDRHTGLGCDAVGCFYGSEDEVKSRRKTVTKDVGNMSVEELVSWVEEEATMASKACDDDISVTSVVDKGKGLADKGKGLVDKGKGIMVDERNAGRKSARSRNSGIVIEENVNPTVSEDDNSDSDIDMEQRFKGSAELEEMYKGNTDFESEYFDKSVDYLSRDADELISLRKRNIEAKKSELEMAVKRSCWREHL